MLHVSCSKFSQVSNWQSYRMQCNVFLFWTTLYSGCSLALTCWSCLRCFSSGTDRTLPTHFVHTNDDWLLLPVVSSIYLVSDNSEDNKFMTVQPVLTQWSLKISNKAVVNFEKIVMLPACVTYLMGCAFIFTFASREFPPTCVMVHFLDSISRHGILYLWPFDL